MFGFRGWPWCRNSCAGAAPIKPAFGQRVNGDAPQRSGGSRWRWYPCYALVALPRISRCAGRWLERDRQVRRRQRQNEIAPRVRPPLVIECERQVIHVSDASVRLPTLHDARERQHLRAPFRRVLVDVRELRCSDACVLRIAHESDTFVAILALSDVLPDVLPDVLAQRACITSDRH